MKVKIAVPDWIARDLEPFANTKVRLSAVRIEQRGATITLVVSDKAVAHPPRTVQ